MFMISENCEIVGLSPKNVFFWIRWILLWPIFRLTPWNFARTHHRFSFQNVVSVQLSSSLESINELDEDAESDLENDEPSTLKKQPGRPRLPVSSVTVKKNSRKGKTDEKKEAPVSRSGCRSRDRARKTSLENTVLTAKNDYRRTFQVAVTSASRLPRVAQEDEEVSDSSAASASVDEGEDEEEKEDGEEDVSELDVTINSAVSGSVPITDDMWQEVCPFDEFIHETDRRIRVIIFVPFRNCL